MQTTHFAGFKIKGLRIKEGYKSTYVAEKLDITPTYLSLIESGKKNPSKKVISKASELFNVDAKEFQESPELMKDLEELEKKIDMANLIAVLEMLSKDLSDKNS
ncbi:helix-turn-helix domain-containing protein [Acinetobacter oleivorans]|uniref:helix-turn-helix domain-containing protein n=1 Tax=Acinetobacter oleivorans TaxID=1148157 RepID=UPI003A8AD8B8